MFRKKACLLLAAVILAVPFSACQRRLIRPGGSSDGTQLQSDGSSAALPDGDFNDSSEAAQSGDEQRSNRPNTGSNSLAGPTVPTGPNNDYDMTPGTEVQNYRVVVYPDILLNSGKKDADNLVDFLKVKGFSAKVTDEAFVAAGKLMSESDCLIMMNSKYVQESIRPQIGTYFSSSKDAVLLGGRAFIGTIRDDKSIKTLKASDDDDYYQYHNLFTLPFYDGGDQYALEGVTRVANVTGGSRTINGNFTVNGSFTGTSAVGIKSTSRSWFFPVLEAQDKYERNRGWAAGTLVHYSGSQSGAQITLYGIQERAYYISNSFAQSLDQILRVMASDKLIDNASTAYKETLKTVNAGSAIAREIEIRNGKFCYADNGEPFYAIGVNMCGKAGFDNFYRGIADYKTMEDAFARMKRAGVNVVRLWGYSRDSSYYNNLKACARKYGVYIILEIAGNVSEYKDKDEAFLRDRAATVADAFKNEPMLLGYDLANEPSYLDLGKVKNSSGVALENLYPYPYFDQYQKQFQMALGSNRTYEAEFFSFPNVKKKLAASSDANQTSSFNNVDNIMRTAIGWLKEGIRSKDTRHPVTVGYFNALSMMPNADTLDFFSNHLYDYKEAKYETIQMSIATMDRLKSTWTGKPIMLGEFGYPNGYARSSAVGNGKALDVYSAGLAESVYYVYSYAKDYDGVTKWFIDDLPYYASLKNQTWLSNDAARITEGSLGMFYYDGTTEGRPKPVVRVTSFLREIMGKNLAKGTFRIFRDNSNGNRCGTGYEYIASNAYMAGGSSYNSAKLSFTTPNGKPSAVMGYWSGSQFVLSASNDTNITIDIKAFGFNSADRVTVAGKAGKTENRSGKLYLEMLEGERIVITNK